MAEYIEREKVYPIAKQICDAIDSKDFQRLNFGMRILDWIDDLPAADVRPVVRGKWEEVEVIWLEDVEDQPDAIASMFCPKCQRFANHVYHYGDPTSGMNYCPNCGADMRPQPPKEE